MVAMDEMDGITTTNHGGGYNRLFMSDISGVATVIVAVEAPN